MRQSSFSISFQSRRSFARGTYDGRLRSPALAIYGATGRLAIALAARAVPEGAVDDQINSARMGIAGRRTTASRDDAWSRWWCSRSRSFVHRGVVVLVVGAFVAMVMVTWRGVSRTLRQMREARTADWTRIGSRTHAENARRLQEEVIPWSESSFRCGSNPAAPQAERRLRISAFTPARWWSQSVAARMVWRFLGHHEAPRDGDVSAWRNTSRRFVRQLSSSRQRRPARQSPQAAPTSALSSSAFASSRLP